MGNPFPFPYPFSTPLPSNETPSPPPSKGGPLQFLPRWNLRRWTQFWFELYLFFIPFTHWVALRNISLFTSAAFLLLLLVRKGATLPPSKTPLWIGIGIGVSNLIGLLLQQVDIGGSLFEIWTNLAEDLYILVATLLLYRSRGEILRLLTHLVVGYLIITFASGVEVVKFYFTKGWAFLMDRAHRAPYYWWGGFARLSALYLPITAGWAVVVWPRLTPLLRWGVGVGIGLGFLLMLLYRSSGPIVLTSGALLLLLLLRFRPRKIWIIVGVVGLVGGAFLFDRTIGEGKIFNPREYDLLHNQWSFNGRGGQWRGFLEMLDTPEKVLFGYGYGWKKFGEIGALHYRERFKREGNWNGYQFFCCYGSANPHNGYLEVLIESGVVGELLFLLLLGYGFKLALQQGEIGRYIGLPFLVSYTLNSLLNGYWEGNGGKLLFLIISLLFLIGPSSGKIEEKGS